MGSGGTALHSAATSNKPQGCLWWLPDEALRGDEEAECGFFRGLKKKGRGEGSKGGPIYGRAVEEMEVGGGRSRCTGRA